MPIASEPRVRSGDDERVAGVIGVATQRRLVARDPGVALARSGSCGKSRSHSPSPGNSPVESVDFRRDAAISPLDLASIPRLNRLGGEPPNRPRGPGGESFVEPDTDSTRSGLSFVDTLPPRDFDLIEKTRPAELVSCT